MENTVSKGRAEGNVEGIYSFFSANPAPGRNADLVGNGDGGLTHRELQLTDRDQKVVQVLTFGGGGEFTLWGRDQRG